MSKDRVGHNKRRRLTLVRGPEIHRVTVACSEPIWTRITLIGTCQLLDVITPHETLAPFGDGWINTAIRVKLSVQAVDITP